MIVDHMISRKLLEPVIMITRLTFQKSRKPLPPNTSNSQCTPEWKYNYRLTELLKNLAVTYRLPDDMFASVPMLYLDHDAIVMEVS